jgi:hypothetical protein
VIIFLRPALLFLITFKTTNMKKTILALKTAFVIAMICFCGAVKAQWYSYDGFEKQSVTNIGQTSTANLIINTAGRSKNRRDFIKDMDQRAFRLKNLLDTVKRRKDSLIARIKDAIVSLAEEIITAGNDNKRDSLQKRKDSLNINLQAAYANRSLEDMIKTQRAQFKYAKKRVPGIHFFPAEFKSASYAFFDNSDTIIQTDEGIFQFEHAYLNYLTQSNRIAAYTEPLFDHIGPVRVSLGLMALAPAAKDSAKTTKQSDSIWNKKTFMDKFRSGGGLAQINFMYPLLFIHDNKYIDFKLYASPRFSIDVPREDTSIQRFAHHTQIGVEAQLKIKTFKDNFNFLLCFRSMQAWGNKTFMDNMGFQGKDRKSFNFNTWTVGLIAKKHLALYYTWYTGDSRAINQVSQQNNNSLTANYQF